jgi:hypothetical protein
LSSGRATVSLVKEPQIINAIRGHLSEDGLIAPQGPSHAERLIAQVAEPQLILR